MSWGKAMWRLYKFLVGLSTAVIAAIIIFWIITLTSCSKQNLVTVRYEICLDAYHEHFFLERYDEHVCLHIEGNCDVDTLTIKVK
jgi:hypothetical protein